MSVYRFATVNKKQDFTPEYKALTLAFNGSIYGNSVFLTEIDKTKGNSQVSFQKSVPIFELLKFVKSMKFTDEKDYYVCPNLIKKGSKKRTEDTLFSSKNIVIDIDAHDYFGDLSKIKSAFINMLRNEFEENRLILWNIQVFTGRGFQLWWCLEETPRQLFWLHKNVQAAIMDRIQGFIDDFRLTFDEAFEVDRASSSKIAGLFRLFGTYHHVTKTKTEIEILNENYNSLNYLKDAFFVSVNREHGSSHSFITKQIGNNLYNKSINEHRVQVIERLAKMRKDITGTRELMAYVYYNECVQAYERSEAKTMLDSFVRLFTVPLKSCEINALIKGIDKAVNKKNDTNCYILTNAKIIEMLDVSEEEQNLLGFFPGISEVYDKNRARNIRRQSKKEKRNDVIFKLAGQGLKRIEIADKVGCSYPTVYRVLKEMNFAVKDKVMAEEIEKKNVIENASVENQSVFSCEKHIKMEDKIYYMDHQEDDSGRLGIAPWNLFTIYQYLSGIRGEENVYTCGCNDVDDFELSNFFTVLHRQNFVKQHGPPARFKNVFILKPDK